MQAYFTLAFATAALHFPRRCWSDGVLNGSPHTQIPAAVVSEWWPFTSYAKNTAPALKLSKCKICLLTVNVFPFDLMDKAHSGSTNSPATPYSRKLLTRCIAISFRTLLALLMWQGLSALGSPFESQMWQLDIETLQPPAEFGTNAFNITVRNPYKDCGLFIRCFSTS